MRDVRGKPVRASKNDKDTAPDTEKAGDKNNNPDKRKDPKAFDKHAEAIQEHNDRLANIEKILGVAKPADNMKGEDQMADKKETAGKVTEKSPHYGRKRH